MADEKRYPALCLALVDPLPADMATVAEWYVAEVQRLDSIAESEKATERQGDIANMFNVHRQNVEV